MKKLINLTMFDMLKGIAVLGVVFGHSFGQMDNAVMDWYGKFAHSLLMPAFFIVSGYWLKKKKVSVGVKSAIDYLLKPYLLMILIIDGIGLVHRALQGNYQEWVDEFLIPSVLVSTDGATRIGPLWFVFALFIGWSLFAVVINIKNEKIHIAIAVLASIAGCALMPLKLPFQIAQGLVGFGFVYCGFLLKKKKVLEKKIHPLAYILMGIVWIATVIWGSMDLYMYDIKYGIFSVVGSVFGSFLMIKVFLYLNLLEWRILDGIRWMGRCSMWVICAHAIEYAIVPWKILFRFVEQNSLIGSTAHFVLRLIFIIVVCLVVQHIQKIRIRKKANAS